MPPTGDLIKEAIGNTWADGIEFFFSSRRRHTRWNCDWSSDVCSSDLIGLAEIYDTAGVGYGPTTPRLVNVSARAQVGTGDGVLIAGFVVEGTSARSVLIRADRKSVV